MVVRWHRQAAADLVAIVRYLKRHASFDVAQGVATQIRTRTASLRDFPRRGRVVPELQRIGVTQWRELIVPPYRVIYRVDAKRVQIDAILDARRDLEELLLERMIRS